MTDPATGRSNTGPCTRRHGREVAACECGALHACVREMPLRNAVKYSPNGGLIEVRVRAGKRSVTVCERGPGIRLDADEVPHVFERFYRAKGAYAGRRWARAVHLPGDRGRARRAHVGGISRRWPWQQFLLHPSTCAGQRQRIEPVRPGLIPGKIVR
jgi:hypothetical protein